MLQLKMEENNYIFIEITNFVAPFDKEVHAKVRAMVEQEVAVEVYEPIRQELSKYGTT